MSDLQIVIWLPVGLMAFGLVAVWLAEIAKEKLDPNGYSHDG